MKKFCLAAVVALLLALPCGAQAGDRSSATTAARKKIIMEFYFENLIYKPPRPRD